MDHEPESIDKTDKVQPVPEGDSPDTAWIPSYIDPDDGEEYLLLDNWDDEDEDDEDDDEEDEDDEDDEDDDDDDGPDDEYFRELCESLLDAHRVEWFLDGGGSGDLTIDLRTGVYTLSGFERQGRDLDEDDEDDDDEAQDSDGDGEGTIPDDEAEHWDDDEEWREVEFTYTGMLDRKENQYALDDDDEELLLNPDGSRVAFPAHVRLGHARAIIEFNGCADEGEIGSVYFMDEGDSTDGASPQASS